MAFSDFFALFAIVEGAALIGFVYFGILYFASRKPLLKHLFKNYPEDLKFVLNAAGVDVDKANNPKARLERAERWETLNVMLGAPLTGLDLYLLLGSNKHHQDRDFTKMLGKYKNNAKWAFICAIVFFVLPFVVLNIWGGG